MAISLQRNGLMAEINVTPFVDVMLVLLIIFMVTAPMLSQGLDVNLPQTRTVDVLPTDNDHMVLTVKKDGAIFLDEYSVPMAELQGKLKTNVLDKKKALFMRADKEVPYGTVVEVMGEVKAAGIDKMSVVAEKTEGPARSEKTAPTPAKKGK